MVEVSVFSTVCIPNQGVNTCIGVNPGILVFSLRDSTPGLEAEISGMKIPILAHYHGRITKITEFFAFTFN
jgi:hypothetical protein